MGNHHETRERECVLAAWRRSARMRCAIAILYSTIMGTTVQLSGLRQQVDVHYSRGLSYLKIGSRWLRGTIHKGRELFRLLPLPAHDLEPCFASRKAEADYYEQLLFSRIRSLHCST